ncbi:hypothetical protein CDL12_09670 [Handroanthus impetiginosus]|uniref:BHLH domain-containing protein n=1 Tax=Handroanthus impetiginosus TaxID=429701 RepID=A0A2G9HJG0_9LAMI|nr:hypothetical protein CDL12_09670 [Handroanthus impetiginosus]
MEISSFRSLAELGMDDPLSFQQWPLEELIYASNASLFSQDFHPSFSQQVVMDFKRAPDLSQEGIKNTIWSSCKLENTSSSSNTLNLPSESVLPQSSLVNQSFITKQAKNTRAKTKIADAPDHILAERKRREKLNQRFISLSAIVPGLKKMDKASVLGEAIKHLKQLQEKVKILEDQTKKTSMESVVFVKKYEVYGDDGENSYSGPMITEQLPEIEARFCNKDVLIIIHCEKRKGIVEKAVAVIEKLHLSVVNSCVMSFGDCALNITLTAQKDENCTMNVKELVKNIRDAIKFHI